MERKITFWKNVGDERFSEKEFELFKARWDDEKGEYVRDEDGPYDAIYEPEGPGTVKRLYREPDFYGEITHVGFTPPDAPKEVVNLEAEDISVTPEGLDLGEEE